MKKILVAVDGSKREQDVVQVAVSLAQQSDTKLILLRAVSMPIWRSPEAEKAIFAEEELAREDLQLIAHLVPKSVPTESHVIRGATAGTIVKFARENDVDLIIMGAHTYEPIDCVVGTIASDVVNHADRAVLVVRAGERMLGRTARQQPSLATAGERISAR